MKSGHLSDYFTGVAVKTLSIVDATPARSNQHEIGTTEAMRSFLGGEKRTFVATYLWLEGEQESIAEEGTVTLYDSREGNPQRRPEWRLYYLSNAVTEIMSAGDTLFVAKRPDESLMVITTPSGSPIQNQLLWLFGFASQPQLRFTVQEVSEADGETLDFVTRRILDEIGIEFEDPRANTLDAIVERFGDTFPSSREFSDLARLTLPDIRAEDDPDAALMAWLNHEEAMFRRLERRVVKSRLEAGFGTGENMDTDGFLNFSLSVQNRRKARMGLALENHLEAIFRAHRVQYTRHALTERRSTADFVFPSVQHYHDAEWPAYRLTMLAAKATCKDRWRQVLVEADRIPSKHLLTLEPAISIGQTEQMKSHGLQLVIPHRVHDSYSLSQRRWLWNLRDFVALAELRQP